MGNGSYSKSHFHADDVIAAMLRLISFRHHRTFNGINVGADEDVTVREITELAVELTTPDGETKIKCGASNPGWRGDVPIVRLSSCKSRELGWNPGWKSKDAVTDGIQWVISNGTIG